MKKIILNLIVWAIVFSCSQKLLADDNSIPPPTPRPFLNSTQYNLLQELLNTHLNYFLSNDAITVSGLPLGAYKEGQRGRYNYSNPTEWGYAMLAWIVAAQRGRITQGQAAAKIELALNTIIALQNNPTQNYQKLFYPYYYVANAQGNDLPTPYHDANHSIPSIDNGFLYTSLLITEGWAKLNSLTTVQNKAHSISSVMNFRMFLEPSGRYIAHLINADTGNISPSHWDIYADEGGVMAWIAYASGSITFNEYKILISAMLRPPRSWNGITVEEAAWFNAMFTWGVRSLAAFPVASWETGLQNNYSSRSFANTAEAHLVYGQWLGVYYPAFSDAMTQPGAVGRYTPPNIPDNVPTDIPAHVVPHAFFVPFCIGPDLKPDVLNTLITKISNLKNDSAGYYHNGTGGHKPFGLEVTASPRRDDTGYGGIESRYIYETLSHSYILLSIYHGLCINDGNRTFLHYACELPGYFQKIRDVLAYLYPTTSNTLRVPQDYPTIQAAINAAISGDTILVAAGTYNEVITLNKSGIILQGNNRNSVIVGVNGSPVIYCQGITGNETLITGFTIRIGESGIRCAGTVNSLRIEDNLIDRVGDGIDLENGASCTIINNNINNCAPIYTDGNNNVFIIGNTFLNTIGPNPPGISLNNTTGLIKNNVFRQRWNGAIKLNNNTNVEIINNRIERCYGWSGTAGIDIVNSTANIRNNLISNNQLYQTPWGGCGLYAVNSDVSLYNNIFYNNRYEATMPGRGAAVKVVNTNFVAKNNIFQANSNAEETVYFEGTGTQDFSYNDMWANNTDRDTTGITPRQGAIAVNPLFVDTIDFYLNVGSPCIDAGDPNPQFNDLNLTRNDMGIYGGPYGKLFGYVLNMTEMNWYQNIPPYSSTGAAACQMILNYIRAGAGEPLLTQNQIYEYARMPLPFNGTELNANEVDKALGHFDPYDYLVSNWADGYDTLIDGNPYQGYNFTVDTYNPAQDPDAINKYMRDICHWMAYTVTKEDWWRNGAIVARPNTPAAIPIYGSYNNWIVVKGFIGSVNPTPYPHTNPYYTPDFTIYGFWLTAPNLIGIGQDTYKTAAECRSTYFLPLSTTDSYNGLFLQIAEPPPVPSSAKVAISWPKKDLASLNFIGVNSQVKDNMTTNYSVAAAEKPHIPKKNWRDLVDSNLLLDPEAVAAFDGTRMGKPILVRRIDKANSYYYLVPFGKNSMKNQFLASGVIILDAKDGYFKEASWAKKPELFLRVDKEKALQLIKHRERFNRRYSQLLHYLKYAKAELIWKPGIYSTSPYKPYWKITAFGYTWYVTQEGRVYNTSK